MISQKVSKAKSESKEAEQELGKDQFEDLELSVAFQRAVILEFSKSLASEASGIARQVYLSSYGAGSSTAAAEIFHSEEVGSSRVGSQIESALDTDMQLRTASHEIEEILATIDDYRRDLRLKFPDGIGSCREVSENTVPVEALASIEGSLRDTTILLSHRRVKGDDNLKNSIIDLYARTKEMVELVFAKQMAEEEHNKES